MTESTQVERVAAGEGNSLDLPGRYSRELFGGVGSASTVRHVIIPADTTSRRHFHRHHGCEEIIYVLAGRGSLRSPSSATPVRGGDTLRIPPDLPHMTVLEPGETLELLCFFPHSDIAAITEELPA